MDDKTYSSTGEAFSTIVLPHCESTQSKKLQADDVSLAYEFSKKFRTSSFCIQSVPYLHPYVLLTLSCPVCPHSRLHLGEPQREGCARYAFALPEPIRHNVSPALTHTPLPSLS